MALEPVPVPDPGILFLEHVLRRALVDSDGWSVQGLGMFRFYLSREVRLHVWHAAYKVPNVSELHSHPWDFTSRVLVGHVINRVWEEVPLLLGPTHTRQRIVCGTGGGAVPACVVGARESVRLLPEHSREYRRGQSYSMSAHQVHRTDYSNGTVTMVRRRHLADSEHAFVYFELGTEWVSAEPRAARPEELAEAVEAALERIAGR